MKTIEVEPDRAAAIKLAVQEAGPDDIVLVAGKGHENYQLVMNQSYSFDDKIEVKKALEASLRTGAASS
jgi:UDP-N-acetylmuramoyl-L-alanyl-D-glutamate--2,6-diaminopimelate ligase